MQNSPKQNNNQLDELLKTVSEKLGADSEKLRSSAQKGDLAQTLQNMKPEDAQRLQKILSDKNATEKLLATPQAQALLKKLME